MTRDLDPAFVAAIAGRTLSLVQLVGVRFTDGWVRYTSFTRSITYDSNTYTAAGNLLSVSEIDEILALKANGVEITLSGVKTENKALVLNEKYSGNDCFIALLLLADNDASVVDYVAFRGIVDTMSLSDDPANQTATITLNCTNELIRFEDVNGLRTNAAEWRLLYPNDAMMDSVAALVEPAIDW